MVGESFVRSTPLSRVWAAATGVSFSHKEHKERKGGMKG